MRIKPRVEHFQISLIYNFVKANELVLSKLKISKKATLSEINEDLLEDAFIENKQALDMAQIYSNIQSGMMDTFASVISNNLNVVMKQLASISIILMIPTFIRDECSKFHGKLEMGLSHRFWNFGHTGNFWRYFIQGM